MQKCEGNIWIFEGNKQKCEGNKQGFDTSLELWPQSLEYEIRNTKYRLEIMSTVYNFERQLRHSIQGLIDGRVEPELFTTKLQKELNSSPQVDTHKKKIMLWKYQAFLLTALPGALPEEVSSISATVSRNEGTHH